jgi:hypothetical protein
MSIQDNANWAVRKAAAAWAATKADRPVWASSVFTIDEAIENMESDLEDRTWLDPMFFFLSKATGKSSRLIVAAEIVVNQVQAHPSWFSNLNDEEKFGDLDPDKLVEAHMKKEQVTKEEKKNSKGKNEEAEDGNSNQE